MRLGGRLAVALIVLSLTVPLSPTAVAGPQPALACEEGEMVHDRLFPEPDEVTDFLSFDEARCGLEVLEERHEDLIEVKTVGQSVGWDNHVSGEHDTFPVLAVEVTDETVPMSEKKGNLVFINSIHGNEKGAREGALRVIEDLVTDQGVAAQVPDATGSDLATVLDEVRLVFTFPNPDGWTHEYAEYRANDACNVSPGCIVGATGPNQPGTETQNFVRVNGNGTNLNRQYPTTGTPHPSWPAMTEPEVDGQVRYFENLTGDVIAGVDLHGMLNAENLTYLMIKDTQRDLAEVPAHEAVARTTASYLEADATLDPWRAAVGPATVWGATYDLLGYSAPGTGGAYVVQDTGLNAPGFTVEIAYNHIAFDNHYPGPGQLMNIMHVSVMRDITLGFLDFAYHQPGNVTASGEASIGVLQHPSVAPGGRYDGTDADPTHALTELADHGADVRVIDTGAPLTEADLEGLTHLVVPDTALDEVEGLDTIQAWTDAGGTLVLTDRAIQHAAELGLAGDVETIEDVAGEVDRLDTSHALAAGTNEPVESIVDGNPLRYDAGTVPNHCLVGFEGDSVGERVLPGDGATSEGTPCTVVGEASLGEGTVRVIGVALPPPVDAGPHGVDSYALTPNGYRILANSVGLDIANGTELAGSDSDSLESNGTPGAGALAALAALALAGIALRRRR